VGAHGIPGWDRGDPWALGTLWPLGTHGPLGIRAPLGTLGPVYYLYGSTLVSIKIIEFQITGIPGGFPWDPRVASHGIRGEVARGIPGWALGDPWALGTHSAVGTHWTLGTIGPWGPIRHWGP